nr:Tn3 family transposase [Carbonactinospora thermoautotrophica]
MHILRLADEPGYRRQIKTQANLQEDRCSLARKIFHGRAGQLYQHYYDGMEDQIGALGLVLNAVVLFNTRYMDAAVTKLPSCPEACVPYAIRMPWTSHKPRRRTYGF